MNKTEILDIVNEPSKHILIAKIVGVDRIVYSSKFVELLELIPTMLTKADLVAMLTDLQLDVEGQKIDVHTDKDVWNDAIRVCSDLIQQKINELKGNKDGSNTK